MKKVCWYIKKIFASVKDWLQENYFVIILNLLFIIFLLVLIILVKNINQFKEILEIFFWDNKEKMINWGPVTVGVAISTFLYTRKKYKADLVSQSRIKWLNTVREISSDIISYSNQVASTVNTIMGNYEKLEELRRETKETKYETVEDAKKKIEIHNTDAAKRANEARYNVVEKTTLFKMYFGPNEENDDLLNKSECVLKLCDDIFNFYTTFSDGETKVNITQLSEELQFILSDGEKILDDFSDSCRKYYQKEWKRAKRGK